MLQKTIIFLLISLAAQISDAQTEFNYWHKDEETPEVALTNDLHVTIGGTVQMTILFTKNGTLSIPARSPINPTMKVYANKDGEQALIGEFSAYRTKVIEGGLAGPGYFQSLFSISLSQFNLLQQGHELHVTDEIGDTYNISLHNFTNATNWY